MRVGISGENGAEPIAAALQSAAATDVGAVRRVNEDSCLARPDIGLWAVADGMGGHQAGDFASQTIVANLAAIEREGTPEDIEDAVADAIQAANQTLCDEAQRRGGGTVIGATVVALMADTQQFICLWAGDSRLYRWRDGQLAQLTRDHSQVQDMVDTGVLAAEAAEAHPLANVITRAVGTGPGLRLDRISGEVATGDVFVVCTDGLSKMVPDLDIAGVLAANDVAALPAALIEAALARGGKDNVTVVVASA